MKNIFIAAIICAALIVTGCGGDKTNSNSTSTKHEQIVVVGIDDEFPPMAFRDDSGRIVGFDIDLAKEAARRMGVEFEFKPIVWSDKEQEITSGNIDMIWNGLDITPERKEYMIFSKPYIDDRQILLVRKGNDKDIQTEGDLTGKIVGAQVGSTAETYVNESPYLKDSFAKFVTYDNLKDGLELLSNGDIDALIVSEISGRYEAINHRDKFETVSVMIGPAGEIGIGFGKKNVELRDKVQKVFDEMVHDGTAKKISEKWFDSDLIKYIK